MKTVKKIHCDHCHQFVEQPHTNGIDCRGIAVLRQVEAVFIDIVDTGLVLKDFMYYSFDHKRQEGWGGGGNGQYTKVFLGTKRRGVDHGRRCLIVVIEGGTLNYRPTDEPQTNWRCL